jgi:hypothetical protein
MMFSTSPLPKTKTLVLTTAHPRQTSSTYKPIQIKLSPPLPSPPPHRILPIVLQKLHRNVMKGCIRSYNALYHSFVSHVIAHHPVPGEPEWETKGNVIATDDDKQMVYTILVLLKPKSTDDPFGHIYENGPEHHPMYVDAWILSLNNRLPPHIAPLSLM